MINVEIIYRENIAKEKLPGRIIQKIVGKDSAIDSQKMTVGYAHYSAESGPMEPHNHAEETVVVIGAKDGFVRRGPSKDNLNEKFALKAGTVMYFDELEWHVFEYADGGFVDIIFIYGQVDNIRPEEINQDRK